MGNGLCFAMSARPKDEIGPFALSLLGIGFCRNPAAQFGDATAEDPWGVVFFHESKFAFRLQRSAELNQGVGAKVPGLEEIPSELLQTPDCLHGGRGCRADLSL